MNQPTSEGLEDRPGRLGELSRELLELREQLRLGGGLERIQRQRDQGKLTARDRLGLLLDPDTRWAEIGLLVATDLNESELWKNAGRRVRERFAALDDDQFRRATVHSVIDHLTSDLIQATQQRLDACRVESATEAAQIGKSLVAPSDQAAASKLQMEHFLFERVYRHPELLTRRVEAGGVLEELFRTLVDEPQLLPAKFQELVESDGLRRAVADYVSGMTDRFAWEEHRRLCGDDGRIGTRDSAC